jgi:hypothetical protein
MESLTDAEAIAFHNDGCDAFPGNPDILHLVYTIRDAGQDPDYNWKTLADWLALIPDAIWVDLWTYEVIW